MTAKAAETYASKAQLNAEHMQRCCGVTFNHSQNSRNLHRQDTGTSQPELTEQIEGIKTSSAAKKANTLLLVKKQMMPCLLHQSAVQCLP